MKAWTVVHIAIAWLAGIHAEYSLHLQETELVVKVNPLPYKHLILQRSH